MTKNYISWILGLTFSFVAFGFPTTLFAADIDFSKYYIEEEALTSENTRFFFATHSTVRYDLEAVTGNGVQRAVREAKNKNYDITFVLGEPTEGANKDEIAAAYRFFDILNSREGFINAIRPFVTRQWQSYFLPKIEPDRYVGSYAGYVNLNAPNMQEVVFSGGFIEVCLSASLASVLDAFKKNSQPQLLVSLISDAIYVGNCDADSARIMTLGECKAVSPRGFQNHIESLHEQARSKGLEVTLSESKFNAEAISFLLSKSH